MNQKIFNRNEKHNYSNEEKLALGEKQNTSVLINIAQEDGSNVFELLQNLCIKNIRFIILKCSRFDLFVTFIFILLLLYTQMFLILQFTDFIKSTDYRPTNHRPTDHRPLTHRLIDPPTTDHRPTDPIIIKGNRKMFILQNIHIAEKIITVYYLLYLPIKYIRSN